MATFARSRPFILATSTPIADDARNWHLGAMNHAGEPVRQFVSPDGVMRYSIRERRDGLFQIVHDGAKLPDGSQPYYLEDRIVSGMFATADLAEEEMQRHAPGTWVRDR